MSMTPATNPIIAEKSNLSMSDMYTQLSDVENELNGILTYDRVVNKF